MVKGNRIKGKSKRQTKTRRANKRVRHTKTKRAKTKRAKTKQRGGRITFFPQDMINLGRGISSGAHNIVNNYRGIDMVPHLAPTRGHPIDNNVAFINSPRPDIISIRQEANDYASSQ